MNGQNRRTRSDSAATLPLVHPEVQKALRPRVVKVAAIMATCRGEHKVPDGYFAPVAGNASMNALAEDGTDSTAWSITMSRGSSARP
jgi:hypothetical protein